MAVARGSPYRARPWCAHRWTRGGCTRSMGCGVGTQSIDLEGDGAVAKLCSRVFLLGQRTPRSALRRRRRAPKAFVRSFYSLPPHQPRPHTLPTTTVASLVVSFLTDIWLCACTRDARSARVRCAARVYSYARRVCMRRRGKGAVASRCTRACTRAGLQLRAFVCDSQLQICSVHARACEGARARRVH